MSSQITISIGCGDGELSLLDHIAQLFEQQRDMIMASFQDLQSQLDAFKDAFSRVEGRFAEQKSALDEANSKLDALKDISDNGTEEEFNQAVEDIRALLERANAVGQPPAPPVPPLEPEPAPVPQPEPVPGEPAPEPAPSDPHPAPSDPNFPQPNV